MDDDDIIAEAKRSTRKEFVDAHPGVWLAVNALNAAPPSSFATVALSANELPTVSRVDEVAALAKAPGNPYPDRIAVGRARNCDIVLRDRSVSKLHAHFLVEREHGPWVASVVDLNSHNGTRVNGTRVPSGGRATVGLGDVVTFGIVSVTLCDAGALHDLLSR